jgi:hypothetical protein
MSETDAFEDPKLPRRPRLQDVGVSVETVQVSSDDAAEASKDTQVELQVFYFSQKMFHYMCENGTADRISQEAIRSANQRKGDILKRQEATLRTANLRELVQEKRYEKPSGPEIAGLRRKRSATKRNTDQVMGRSADQEKRRRYNATEQSDASRFSHTEELLQQPASAGVSSQQGQGKSNKKRRVLWGKYHVPNPSHEPQAHCDDVEKTVPMRSVVPILAKQLAVDFQFNGEDDYVPIDDAFRLPQTNYETHGHFLSSCIAFCTLKKTGHSFVRASVDSQKQAVVMKCKLSSHLTGRATLRKKQKEDDYSAQAAAMFEDMKARDNALWAGKQRISFTTFGLSGDAGFLNTSRIGSVENLSFSAEFELVDAAQKVQKRFTVARVAGTYLHIQGGKMCKEPTMEYDGLDARDSDTKLLEFYAFLRLLLLRQHNLKVKLKNSCWRTQQDLTLLSAHPNVIMFDTTCKTNVKNKHFRYGSGVPLGGCAQREEEIPRFTMGGSPFYGYRHARAAGRTPQRLCVSTTPSPWSG